MVDYKAIADTAQAYPDYQSAYAAMIVEKEPTTYKDLTPNLLKKWAAFNPNDYAALKAATDAASILAVSMIESETAPLVMSDPDTHILLASLPMSQAGKDALVDMASINEYKWPHIKLGHVKKAYDMRNRGEL